MSAKTDYFENKLTDFIFRGQSLVIGDATASWSTPPTFFIGLQTTSPTDGTPGVEVSGGGYARQPVVASLINMAGTQAPGSTTVSTGTNATTSNNLPMTFLNMPDISVDGLVSFGIYDSLTGGSLLEYAPLTGQPIKASAGATLSFATGSLTAQEDN